MSWDNVHDWTTTFLWVGKSLWESMALALFSSMYGCVVAFVTWKASMEATGGSSSPPSSSLCRHTRTVQKGVSCTPYTPHTQRQGG